MAHFIHLTSDADIKRTVGVCVSTEVQEAAGCVQTDIDGT